jgi:hypothetical protein
MAGLKMTPERVVAAREMRDVGVSWRGVAEIFGVDAVTVRKHVDPDEREKRQARDSARLKLRAARDPDRWAERQKRIQVRKHARKEAAATGEDVEAVYARWGVPTIRSGP